MELYNFDQLKLVIMVLYLLYFFLSFITEVAGLAIRRGSNDSLAISQILGSPSPYDFPALADPANLFPMPPCNGITLEEATIDQLQAAMNSCKLTSVQLVMCYMTRISQTDGYIK